MIYLEDLKVLVSRLESDHQKQEVYIDSLRDADVAISDVIIENKYTNILALQNMFLLEHFLGSDLFGWVEWYLYESSLVLEKGTPNAWVDDVGYSITDIDSFMNFAQHGLKIPMHPKHL